ncbi:MAG: ADP-ribose pyrophosphatase [Kiritimatiellia bacterium]|jgi:ADP-ribose pyrophosphatase
MPCLIVGTGLTEDTVGPANRFLSGRQHIGLSESARLLGQGREYGDGPVPLLMRAAIEHGERSTGVLLVVEEDPGPAGLVAPIADLLDRAHVVQCSQGRVAYADLEAGLHAAVGAVTFTADDPLRLLIVGCNTEGMVLGLANVLHRFLQHAEVAVCSHLVGSAVLEAHLAVLRHTLPKVGVRVLLSLTDAAEFVGLDPGPLERFGASPCVIGPKEAREVLGDDARQIAELLCLQWTKAELRPLMGGFSGSLLFLADGWKGTARTEPMVLKIDDFGQMRRELRGYYQVKDLLGKHVPSFGYPIARGDWMGVSMELAAMEGRPETLQDTFEAAIGESGLQQFMRRFDKALDLLSDKLYRNTLERSTVVPYRSFGLQMRQQAVWLQENGEAVAGYLDEAGYGDEAPDLDEMVMVLTMVSANPDGIEQAACLQHGDINFANVICDEGDNCWFIDWTHAAVIPLELDFAKLENDTKFVMSKDFDVEDLPRLRRFEEYILAHPMPARAEHLPDDLKFARWDLRFRKILGAVRRIRAAYFDLQGNQEMLSYRVALLRYALHTLSFDERRGRGECKVQALAYALQSIDLLLFDLISDDYHLRIRTERPAAYPPRQRISIDEAPWLLDCETYDPPYFVHPDVLASDRLATPGGWADPEDMGAVRQEIAGTGQRLDDRGRPLNPRGRTGIAGRGSLGRWGTNPEVTVCIIRASEDGTLEIALGRRSDGADLELPRGFVLRDEQPLDCLARVLATECSVARPQSLDAEIVSDGYTYDIRQTDHAWVQTMGMLLFDAGHELPDIRPTGDFEELKWWPLDYQTTNRVPPSHAAVVRHAIARLRDTGRMTADDAEHFLNRTG